MSHLMMTRRLLGAGLRRPAPSSACVGLASSMESLSLHNQSRVTPAPIFFPCNHYFSSVPPKKDLNSTIVELPPNLKFDPRATASPFYGAERVSSKKKRAPKKKQTEATSAAVEKSSEDEKDNKEVIEGSSELLDEEEDLDDYEEDSDEEDDEEEEERILYDLSTKPDVPRAVPLPQRLHVPVIDIKSGEEVGTFHLSERTFGNDPVRVDILQRCVVWQRNKKRGKRNAGARTKTISEVSGSGKKVRKQKGSGMARAGHSRPAHWRGGAKAHGPKGRIQDYTTKLNKKVRKMGVRHALSQKLYEGNLIVTSDLAAPTHKTKDMDIMLNRLGIGGKNGVMALMIDDAKPEDAESESSVYGGLDVNFKVASGNLRKVKMQNQMACNVYDMLKFKKLVVSLSAITSLEERLERDL